MSTLVEEGPGAVAMHAVNNARQLLTLPEPNLARVAELLAPVPDLLLRQETYIERLETKNSELNIALIDANNRLAAACKGVEHLYLGASMDLERHTSRFTAICEIRNALDPSITVLKAGALLQRSPAHAPRTTAAGR